MAKDDKTNVMRLLEQAGVDYQAYQWTKDQLDSGDLDAPVYKTLVTEAKTNQHYVFVIPVSHHLNLKAAARAVGEKKINMIKERDLLPLTGYVHGGCSPIGMKKPFPTVIDQSAQELDKIIFSAGKVGYSVGLNPENIRSIIDFNYAPVADEEEA